MRVVNTRAAAKDALDALSAELGGADLPPGVSALSEDTLRHLVESIRAQKTRQRQALDTAISEGLAVVPAMLRGVVRKALFKGG